MNCRNTNGRWFSKDISIASRKIHANCFKRHWKFSKTAQHRPRLVLPVHLHNCLPFQYLFLSSAECLPPYYPSPLSLPTSFRKGEIDLPFPPCKYNPAVPQVIVSRSTRCIYPSLPKHVPAFPAWSVKVQFSGTRQLTASSWNLEQSHSFSPLLLCQHNSCACSVTKNYMVS